jgi:hypothetical protein
MKIGRTWTRWTWIIGLAVLVSAFSHRTVIADPAVPTIYLVDDAASNAHDPQAVEAPKRDHTVPFVDPLRRGWTELPEARYARQLAALGRMEAWVVSAAQVMDGLVSRKDRFERCLDVIDRMEQEIHGALADF